MISKSIGDLEILAVSKMSLKIPLYLFNGNLYFTTLTKSENHFKHIYFIFDIDLDHLVGVATLTSVNS